VVIFALLAFGELFGFAGVLLALPVSAALLVGLVTCRSEYHESPLYSLSIIRGTARFRARVPEPPSFANFWAGRNAELVDALLAFGPWGETGMLIWGGPGVGRRSGARPPSAWRRRVPGARMFAHPRDLDDETLASVSASAALLIAIDGIDLPRSSGGPSVHALQRDQGASARLIATSRTPLAALRCRGLAHASGLGTSLRARGARGRRQAVGSPYTPGAAESCSPTTSSSICCGTAGANAVTPSDSCGAGPAVAGDQTADHRAITQGLAATGAGMEAGSRRTPHNA